MKIFQFYNPKVLVLVFVIACGANPLSKYNEEIERGSEISINFSENDIDTMIHYKRHSFQYGEFDNWIFYNYGKVYLLKSHFGKVLNSVELDSVYHISEIDAKRLFDFLFANIDVMRNEVIRDAVPRPYIHNDENLKKNNTFNSVIYTRLNRGDKKIIIPMQDVCVNKMNFVNEGDKLETNLSYDYNKKLISNRFIEIVDSFFLDKSHTKCQEHNTLRCKMSN